MISESVRNPDCISLGDGYVVEWADDGVRVEAHYLRDNHGDLQAELTWYSRGVDRWQKLRGGGRLNLLASTTVRSAGKVLVEVNGTTWPWAYALEKACELIVEKQREGEPVRRYHQLARTLPEQRWLVDGLIPEGVTSLVRADWESGKSMFGQALQLAVATGTPFCGRALLRSGPVLYLDWETDEQRWARRMGILIRGLEMDEDALYPLDYRRMRGQVRDQVSRLREIIERNHIVAVVVDSLGWAAGGGAGEDLKDAGPAISAMEAIRALRVTAIVLAHQAKAQNGGSGAPRAASTYGSVFFDAGARYVWALDSKREGDDEIVMKLTNAKNNDGPHQKPLAYRLTFAGDRAWFAAATIVAEESILNPRILAALDHSPNSTIAEISRVLDAKAESVRKACDRLADAGRIIKSGAGRGVASKYSLPRSEVQLGHGGIYIPPVVATSETRELGQGLGQEIVSQLPQRGDEVARCTSCGRLGKDAAVSPSSGKIVCVACFDEETDSAP